MFQLFETSFEHNQNVSINLDTELNELAPYFAQGMIDTAEKVNALIKYGLLSLISIKLALPFPTH